MFSSTDDSQFLQSASDYAQRALRCSQNIALAYKVLAICARLQQNYNTALSYVAQSAALLPQDPECYRELAFLSIIAGKFDDASMYASNAILYDPINSKSHLTIAIIQQMKQEYSAAEMSYKQAQLFGEDEEALTINFIQNIWLNEGKYDRIFPAETSHVSQGLSIPLLDWSRLPALTPNQHRTKVVGRWIGNCGANN
jgi:tetratricopeptide (TPR) repeat protein